MTESDVILFIKTLKDFCVKNQEYESASRLRGIENAFLDQYKEKYIKPSEENLIIELNKIGGPFIKHAIRELRLSIILDK